MSNLVHKLFKNKSTQRFIVSLKTPQQHQQQLLPKLSPSPISQETHHYLLAKPEFFNNPNLFHNPKSPDSGKSTEPLNLYPNFPFGYLLKPMSSTGLDPLEVVEIEEGAEEPEDDDAGKVWADSVKKKRKRKMNKHKYKKLRKRLRRRTKT